MEHPCGVQPECAAHLIGDDNSVRTKGLGKLSSLSDEAILNLLYLLSAVDLARLSTCSKALYAFCNYDELWKSLTLESLSGKWEYRSNWRTTYLYSSSLKNEQDTTTTVPKPLLKIKGFYSDLLHRSWLCSTIDIDSSWLEVENIDRKSGLSIEDFKRLYERPNIPVILTDIVPHWPAYTKWKDRKYLMDAFRNHPVLVGDAPMSFESYCAYADAQQDELPLYLFDKHFASSSPRLASDYTIPPHFSEDLFSVLGSARPDYRWLIMGPQRSGSTYHQDPNATCAWNAVVSGSKKWVMYPPGAAVPGVTPSEDGADVAAPVSIIEWFLSFYQLRNAGGTQPLECILKEGEVLFVPRGWWHTALNLEGSIAVTQNYASSSNVEHVLAFLASKNADVLVSGVETEEERLSLHDRFVVALKEKKPNVWEALERKREEKRLKAEVSGRKCTYLQSNCNVHCLFVVVCLKFDFTSRANAG